MYVNTFRNHPNFGKILVLMWSNALLCDNAHYMEFHIVWYIYSIVDYHKYIIRQQCSNARWKN